MNVELFIPCYVDQFAPATALNMIKVLEKTGCKVSYNPEQTCCGLPAYESGFVEHCRPVAEKLLGELDLNKPVVSLSGACTAMVRNQYGSLFHNSSMHNTQKNVQKNFYELSEFLVKVAQKTKLGAELRGKAVYMDNCHALRGCQIREEPRALLKEVRGLELLDWEGGEECCGFGGSFSVRFNELSAELAARKIKYALDAGAEYIISTDLSCLMHLDAYAKKQNIDIKAMHLVDVLAKGW